MINLENFKKYCDVGNTNSVLVKLNIIDDSVFQLALDIGQGICMNIIGNPDDVPTTNTFKGGVFFAGRYYLETRSKTGYQIESDAINIMSERKIIQGIEDMKTHKAFMRILIGMLTSDRNVTAFMPETTNGSS